MTLNDLIYDVLTQCGLELDDNNYICIDDKPIQLNGKFIRFSYDGPFLIDSNTEIWFDILNNDLLMEKLFNCYKVYTFESSGDRILNVKEESINGKTHISFIYVPLDLSILPEGETCIQIQTENYTHISLMYLDALFRMDNRTDIIEALLRSDV